MAYIVQQQDLVGNRVDVFVAQQGDAAYDYYKTLEERTGKHTVRIQQR